MQFIKTTREVSQYYGTDYNYPGEGKKLYKVIPKNTILEVWREDDNSLEGIKTIATTPRPNSFPFFLDRDQYKPLGIVQVNVGGDKGTGRLIEYDAIKVDDIIFTSCRIELITGNLDDHRRNGELWVLLSEIKP